MNFEISEHEPDAETLVLELAGELGLYTAPELKERVLRAVEEGKRRVVVDVSRATFIDSTTLGVLVGGARRLRREGGSVLVVCPDEGLLQSFEVTGLDSLFPIHPSREDALSHAAPTGG